MVWYKSYHNMGRHNTPSCDKFVAKFARRTDVVGHQRGFHEYPNIRVLSAIGLPFIMLDDDYSSGTHVDKIFFERNTQFDRPYWDSIDVRGRRRRKESGLGEGGETVEVSRSHGRTQQNGEQQQALRNSLLHDSEVRGLAVHICELEDHHSDPHHDHNRKIIPDNYKDKLCEDMANRVRKDNVSLLFATSSSSSLPQQIGHGHHQAGHQHSTSTPAASHTATT
ncbi:hypothetical protein FOZ60_012253 [Perkinsus olseni]|uniref:Uncharacterized protein n=1 Tax=Perkinsus olseni TaxID=32597 RepID=A0A7J6NCZ5_PEROL|nr:hypothetical protein FOZ60_012253 [Perkinsus olseni]